MVKGTSHNPEVTLKLSEGNLSKLLKDDLNTAMVFMTGGLKGRWKHQPCSETAGNCKML